MSGKATAVAPSNIAFVKYWGTRDVERTLPYHPSISMTLRHCVSRCTVELTREEGPVEIRHPDGLRPAPPGFTDAVRRHCRRLARWAEAETGMRVAAHNTFPTGAGIASSASGFAALTLAVLAALERRVPTEELSKLARLSGSGSAARSVLGGYVEWPAGAADGEGHAVQIAPPGHWELCDVVAVVDPTPKSVSSREGHRLAPTSPHWPARLAAVPERLARVRRAIEARDLELLGPVLEEEAIELHLVAMSSRPPVFYWQGGTLDVLQLVRRLRDEGLRVWITIDAGPNVHLICPPEDEPAVVERLAGVAAVRSTIRDRVGAGPALDGEHLF